MVIITKMTDAERESIVKLFKSGYLVSEIAEELNRSPQTVTNHLIKVGMVKRKVYKVKSPERHMENEYNRNSGIPDYLV